MPMKRLTIRSTWVVESEDGRQLGPELFAMLNAIHETGKLTAAATQVGLSYRHAWNLVDGWNGFFGTPLVRFERGKGAFLTPLGERLLWAEQRVGARLGVQLESVASEINLEISRLLVTTAATIRIHASHGFAVARMPDLLEGHERLQLDLRYLGSVESLASLARDTCDLAGLHVPEGRLASTAMARYARWLNPARQRLIHLVTRTQGLFVATGNPKGIRTIADLVRPDITFINRQKGAGTRLLFDQVLAEAGITAGAINGYATEEFTHAAVAAYVASGAADAGFGVEPAAHQFRLDFIPVALERYFFVCNAQTLERPEMLELMALLKSDRFTAIVATLPGYSAPRVGEVVRLDDEFPQLQAAGRRPSQRP
ncbi:MAG: helix-turn-helix transcriptional regulator [Burkholderiales bacterium]|nr:helix-turn-helix transcriptional regulator [Burkholderiales bacterium]